MEFGLLVAREANIAVTHVPMFDPSVKGSIPSSDKTPTPTNGVNADVTTEEDCNTIVIPVPTKIAK